MDWSKIIEVVLTSCTSIFIALIAAGYFRRRSEKIKERFSKTQLMKQIEHDEIVHYALRELRRKYNADRVYVWQFHNGGNFYTSSPMQRTSITYERCSEGLERKAEKYQGVLISNFTGYIRDAMEYRMFYHDVEKLPDFVIRSLILSDGTYAHAAVPIFDKENHLTGIMALDWVFSEIPYDYLSDCEFSDEFKTQFTSESSSLTQYL